MKKINISYLWLCIGKIEGLSAGIENEGVKTAFDDVVRMLVEIAEEEMERSE